MLPWTLKAPFGVKGVYRYKYVPLRNKKLTLLHSLNKLQIQTIQTSHEKKFTARMTKTKWNVVENANGEKYWKVAIAPIPYVTQHNVRVTQ